MQSWVDSKLQIYSAMLIMISLMVAISFLALIPFFIISYQVQKQVLLMFLEIPLPKVSVVRASSTKKMHFVPPAH